MTGGDSAISNATADALEVRGARRVILPGSGQRPQDAPAAKRLLETFWEPATLAAGDASRAEPPEA